MNPITTICNVFESVASAELDPAVGISIAHLTGSEQFSLYGAQIAPYKKVAAHFHEYGEELYQIVEGTGVMYIGKQDESSVIWEPPFDLKKGDCFTVGEGLVHQLHNISGEKLIAIFGCPKSHLTSDRIVVKGL